MKLTLTPLQARLVAEAAEAESATARLKGYRNDQYEWDEIAREGHAAADRGYGHGRARRRRDELG